jgi:integrase
MVRRDSAGRETWYDKWRVDGEQVKRRTGQKRTVSTSDGLTKTQAEAELRRLIGEVRAVPMRGERVTVEQAGEALSASRRAMGRKRSTVESYETVLALHIVPFFGARKAVDRVKRHDVEAFAAELARKRLSASSRVNILNLLHSIFEPGLRRGWAVSNPVRGVERPRAGLVDPDIRYMTMEEVEAVLRAVPDDELGVVEGPLYLAAVMTGMRRGELLGLRWGDIDWESRRIRVRRNYVRGEFGPPSRGASSRSVPMTDRLAGELQRLYDRSLLPGDEDQVFARLYSRKEDTRLDGSKLLNRFRGPSAAPACATCASTICATPSARAWPPPAFRCARCRNGWATATSPPRSCTPIIRQARGRRSESGSNSRSSPRRPCLVRPPVSDRHQVATVLSPSS